MTMASLSLIIFCLSAFAQPAAAFRLAAKESTIRPANQSITIKNNTTVSDPSCDHLEIPSCLNIESNGTCPELIQKERPECRTNKRFCGKSVYRLPRTKVMITLPIMSDEDLKWIYAHDFKNGGAPPGWFPFRKVDNRARDQVEFLRESVLEHNPATFKRMSNMSIVEIGCMHGRLLRHLAESNFTPRQKRMRCYEGDPDFYHGLNQTFQRMRDEFKGVQIELIPNLFDSNSLSPMSVDLFASSHVIEHIANPCPLLASVWQALKPGGLMLTEVPEQYDNPGKNRTEGEFHMLYFSRESFTNMMIAAGFEALRVTNVKSGIRSVFRKPISSQAVSA